MTHVHSMKPLDHDTYVVAQAELLRRLDEVAFHSDRAADYTARADAELRRKTLQRATENLQIALREHAILCEIEARSPERNAA